MSDMRWDDLRIFLAVVRTKSLAEGAREAGVDRSTASRRITGLERALKTRLFLRTREGLRPSAAAERLRVPAEAMEAAARAIATDASAGDDAISGEVRIATTEALGTFLVQRGLLRLRERHPELRIEILGGNRPVDLARGEADLALRVTPPTQQGLRVRRVARLRFALYGATPYLRARGVPRTIQELAGHDVLVPSGELAALPEARWLLARPGVRVVMRSSSMPTIVAACAEAQGLAVLAGPWAAVTTGLERVLDVDAIPSRPIWLVTPPDAASRGAVRVVGDAIADLVRRAAGA